MSPERFFMVALPQLIAEQLRAFAAMSGTLTVRLSRDAVWSVRFGNVFEPVVERPVPGADLYLRFTEAAFAGFMDGSLDFAAALDSGEVGLRGNPGLLANLIQLLQPRTSPLGARLANL